MTHVIRLEAPYIKNWEVQSLTNQILNDEIREKNQLHKRIWNKKKYQLKEWGWIKIKNKLEGKKNSLIGGLNWKKKLTKGQKESQKNNDEIRKNKTLQI